jgi:hypothetical protein
MPCGASIAEGGAVPVIAARSNAARLDRPRPDIAPARNVTVMRKPRLQPHISYFRSLPFTTGEVFAHCAAPHRRARKRPKSARHDLRVRSMPASVHDGLEGASSRNSRFADSRQYPYRRIGVVLTD